MLFEELLTLSREQRASDIHLVYGELPTFRVNGELIKIGDELVNKRFLSSGIHDYNRSLYRVLRVRQR